MLFTQIIKPRSKIIYTFLIAFALCVASTNSLFAQQKIRVQGVVRSLSKGSPIANVSIVHEGYLLANTDIDGKFVIVVPRDAVLEFIDMNYDKTTISLGGEQQLEVFMSEMVQKIDDIIVVAQAVNPKFSVDRTDLEVKGNYFHVKTKFRIPIKLFDTDYRYIVQPTVYDVTQNKRHNLRPVVIDGKNYDIVQNRYLDFDDANDKLNDYVIDYKVDKGNEIYPYADSIFFDSKSMKNDFHVDCYIGLYTYRESKSLRNFADTIRIAKGTKNVMRFFTSTLMPLNLDNTTITEDAEESIVLSKLDSTIIPQPEMLLMRDNGVAKINFKINEATIDYTDAQNAESLDEIIQILAKIRDNENAAIRTISMVGYTSPDGNIDQNRRLANRRTKALLDIVTEAISPSMREHITMNSRGVVEPWSTVANLVESDDLPFAGRLRRIVDKVKEEHQQWSIRQLPEYRKVIIPNYLPRLRRIEYSIDYSIFRNRTEAEIAELYEQDVKMSKYEYLKLILAEKDDHKRELIENDAVAAYSNFAWVLNRIIIRKLLRSEIDLELLKDVLAQGAPMPLVYNQTLMALENGEVKLADSLVNTIADYREVAYLKSVVSALNGDYKSAYPLISAAGGLNEVLLMLGLEYNDQAYAKMKIHMKESKNLTDAKKWYVYALCANRVMDITSAMIYMERALELDPSLADVAAVDSDLMDIYELVKPQEREESYE